MRKKIAATYWASQDYYCSPLRKHACKYIASSTRELQGQPIVLYSVPDIWLIFSLLFVVIVLQVKDMCRAYRVVFYDGLYKISIR